MADPKPGEGATFDPKEEQAKVKQIEESKTEPVNDDVSVLLKRVLELESRLNLPQVNANTPVVQRQVVTKYSFKPADYPNPSDRLFEERKLALKGFSRDWWDLDWRVQRVNYEQDGQKYAAPRFEVDLIRIRENEEGEPSNERYVLKRGMFFEDPDSFVEIANQHGIDVPEDLFRDFMDEMRYLTVYDWLVDCFYPPKPSQKKINKRETVIGNRLVEVFEINSEDSQTIPFDKLKS